MANQKSKQSKVQDTHPASKYLPPEVTAKYELVDWPSNSPAQVFGKFGLVDLRKLNLQQAASLVKRKFPKLRLKADH